jgi:hypothetical protein
VPSAGVTISNAGLAASTVYYVYARMSGGAMALELSTTGHTPTNGVETKTGDTTRTLVGMVRTNASSQFVDDATNICVLSFFNRRASWVTPSSPRIERSQPVLECSLK